jgi:hypothetical protein
MCRWRPSFVRKIDLLNWSQNVLVASKFCEKNDLLNWPQNVSVASELSERLLGETKLRTALESASNIRLLDTPAEEGLREVGLVFTSLPWFYNQLCFQVQKMFSSSKNVFKFKKCFQVQKMFPSSKHFQKMFTSLSWFYNRLCTPT